MSSSLNTLDFSSNFLIFKALGSFNEEEAFKEIKELVFLSYYSDFKLLLCSKCLLALNSNAFKSHLYKHLKVYPKNQVDSLISQAIIIFNSLEVFSLKSSLDLIISFSKSFELKAFKELKVLDLFLCTLKPDCFIVLSSKYSIKRHIRESHSNINSNSPYKVIKGQALEINKFFFEVKLNNPLISSLISNNPNNTTLTLIEPLEKAKEVFLATY